MRARGVLVFGAVFGTGKRRDPCSGSPGQYHERSSSFPFVQGGANRWRDNLSPQRLVCHLRRPRGETVCAAPAVCLDRE